MVSDVANTELDMDQVKVDPRWALRIPSNLALRRKLLPFTRQGENVHVACADLNDTQGLEAVQRYVSAPVIPNLAEIQSLDRAINRIFRDPIHASGNLAVPARVTLSEHAQSDDAGGEDIVAFGDEIFHAALIRRATDIHIEPGQNEVRIRLRVDGILEEYRRVPSSVLGPLVSRFKVLAGMDIAERRAPQDGRFTLGREETQTVDIRAATIPTKQGERMTLRLLATHTQDLTLDKLGMSSGDLQVFESAIAQPNGLVLLTGPTGCGKSTTLYAAIRRLIDQRPLNIITIEDPVECVVDGVSQVEVDSADKVNFHKALRSALRHDPDVLMIGEIRDAETAQIAITAALTGHLVFSTLHTNSARSSVTRLVDMGIQPFLVGAVSRLFAAQRLVRRICRRCAEPVELSERQSTILQRPETAGTTVYQSRGCRYCAGTGFVGRTGLFELLPFDHELSEATARRDQQEVGKYLATRPTPLLIDDAIKKLKMGETSFNEIASVVNLL